MAIEDMAFPKETWKRQQSTKRKQSRKKRKKHKKSILHPKDSGYCYLCALLDGDYTYKYTEEHHILFGSGQRELSEAYGLTVQLCMKHHKGFPYAAHDNREIRELLCKKAQETFMEEYPELDWMKIFKKNYLSTNSERS